MTVIKTLLIAILTPIWLPAFAIGLLLGFAWDFFRIGFHGAPMFADWLRIDRGAAE